MQKEKYELIVCGGTFDHFHKGHREFLNFALSLGRKVIIGLTSGKYITSLKHESTNLELIEPFEKRKKKLLEFLGQKGVLSRIKIVKIHDIFGPTLSKKLNIDGIVVSENSKNGAKIINKKRQELGLNQLKILISPSILSKNKEFISSSRIRNGEIDREGNFYIKKLWLEEDLKLTEDLRKKLKNPFGKLYKNIEKSQDTKRIIKITVGDVTTKIFNEKSLGQMISVMDFKVAREKKYSNLSELGFKGNEVVLKTNNPPGFITKDLFNKLSEVFKSKNNNKIVLQVDGEEDLAVLPIIILAPLGSLIYYGQPNKGIVRIEITEEIKKEAYRLLDKFTTRGH